MFENTILEATILEAFEKVWDKKTAELSAQRKQLEECKEKGEEIPQLPLIDFSKLNLLTLQIVQISQIKSAEEISTMFQNMPNKDKTVEEHKKYFGYAMINARYIEQDSNVRIAKIIAEN